MEIEYDSGPCAEVTARFITDINSRTTAEGLSFAQQYMLHEGLKRYGKEGESAVFKEADQLYRRNAFAPIDVSELTPGEIKKAQQALMFLTEKKDADKTKKARMVFNGKPT